MPGMHSILRTIDKRLSTSLSYTAGWGGVPPPPQPHGGGHPDP